jgi:hypothetical protein
MDMRDKPLAPLVVSKGTGGSESPKVRKTESRYNGLSGKASPNSVEAHHPLFLICFKIL